jgi:hypothetical protein
MRILFILLLLVSCSKDAKVPFISKDPAKPINVIIENEFDITYSFKTFSCRSKSSLCLVFETLQ